MHVTIIGAGNMGRGIGHRLVAGGHDVTVVDRDPEEAGRLAEELRGAAEGGATVEAAGPGAQLHGEVVILAVYYPGNLEIARDLGDRLAGKVVVDISNPSTRASMGSPPSREPRLRRRWHRAHRLARGSSRPSTPPSRGRWLKAKWQGCRSMSSLLGTTRRQRRRWLSSCATGICGPST
jgi:hypothetical protein